MKIIQIETLSGPGNRATLFALTDSGAVFYAALDPTGEQTRWELMGLPLEEMERLAMANQQDAAFSRRAAP